MKNQIRSFLFLFATMFGLSLAAAPDASATATTVRKGMVMVHATELVTLTASAAVDSTIALPKGAIVLWAEAVVKTTITGPASWGYCWQSDGTSCTRYGSALSLSSTALHNGATSTIQSVPADTFMRFYGTSGTSFTGGTVKLDVYYIRMAS